VDHFGAVVAMRQPPCNQFRLHGVQPELLDVVRDVTDRRLGLGILRLPEVDVVPRDAEPERGGTPRIEHGHHAEDVDVPVAGLPLLGDGIRNVPDRDRLELADSSVGLVPGETWLSTRGVALARGRPRLAGRRRRGLPGFRPRRFRTRARASQGRGARHAEYPKEFPPVDWSGFHFSVPPAASRQARRGVASVSCPPARANIHRLGRLFLTGASEPR
jgi:hypothetical protein